MLNAALLKQQNGFENHCRIDVIDESDIHYLVNQDADKRHTSDHLSCKRRSVTIPIIASDSEVNRIALGPASFIIRGALRIGILRLQEMKPPSELDIRQFKNINDADSSTISFSRFSSY